MIRLYAVDILPLQTIACYKSCYLRSSMERREKADALKMQDDKARCIAAGLLLEYAYKKFRSEYTKELARANSFGYAPGQEDDIKSLKGLLPEDMPQIVSGERGKPEFLFLGNLSKPICFNLAHSGNYVICAMADFEVGADIQIRTRVGERLVSRFFSEKEKARMKMCGEDTIRRERVFAEIWALKEAQTKLTGRGIGQMLRNVPEQDDEDEFVAEEKVQCRTWQGVIDEDYAWAVVTYPGQTDGVTDGQMIVEPVMVDGGNLFYEENI